MNTLFRRASAALVAAAGLAAPASGTWSIVLIDTRTGEVAVASATCLFNFDLQANTPVLIPGVGGATAQSSVDGDGTNRVFIRDAMLRGVPPAAILAGLSTRDSAHQTRQYGMADTAGETLTFSGASASAWAGGRTGRIAQAGGDIVYAVQGNILTGAPVVDLAVDAIVNTPGGLPEKLMAGMEAARAMGGDGRCSCATGPTACGSPPNVPWDRTAGIAYMLIAREGDKEGCSPIARQSQLNAAAAGDFNRDGRMDLAIGYLGNVGVLDSERVPTGPMLFAPARSVARYSGIRAVAVADFNADGNPDIASANANNSSVGVLLGRGDGTFAATALTSGIQPSALGVGPIDGGASVDIAAHNTFSNELSVFINNGDGTFQSQRRTSVPAGGTGFILADVDRDGDRDALIAYGTSRTIAVWVNDGAGNFTSSSAIALPAAPALFDAGDLDRDGDTDLVVPLPSLGEIRVLLNGPGGFVTSSVTAPTTTNQAIVRDLDGDGVPDLLASTRPTVGGGQYVSFRGRGDGTFEAAIASPINAAPQRIDAADLDGDGRAEGISVNGALVTVTPNTGGVAMAGIGCASSDYYMEFNIPFTTPDVREPVFTLQDMYDNWRSGLVGVSDAVVSAADVGAGFGAAGGGRVELRIELRDWNGAAVTQPTEVRVTHRPADLRGLNASDGRASIGPVVSDGAGRFRAELRSGASCGVDRFRIEVTHPGRPELRPVILMPAPVVRWVSPGDVDGDGTQTPDDLSAFLDRWEREDPEADLNGDGVLDLNDFMRFFNGYDGGCGFAG